MRFWVFFNSNLFIKMIQKKIFFKFYKSNIFTFVSIYFSILICSFTLISCSGDSGGGTPPANTKPSNLAVSAVVVGASAQNLNGDGSGMVNFSISATNATSYKITFGNGDSKEVTDGNFTYTYTASGTNTYTIYVSAYNLSNFVSTSTAFTIYVAPTALWSDEFNIDGAPDGSKWGYDTGAGGWGNNEAEYYTSRQENVIVSGGTLKIKTLKENYLGSSYTSARILSKDKFSFKYGRVDVRAKVPIDAGTWPAIWMLGKNINEDGAYFDTAYGTSNWPACGEIDIMEHGIFPSQSVNYIQGTLHTPSSFGGSVNNGGIVASSDLQNNYHVYSMNWSPFQISFLLDGVVYYTYNPAIKNADTWPFDKEQFLLLNIAMGGTAGTIPSNFTQAAMNIDYVRVYQNTLVDTEKPTNFTATKGAVTGSSVELLLNAIDNSGTVTYNINYGSTNISIANASGVQKSVIIPNLSPNTNYTFAVSVSDLTGNTSPIILLH